MKSRIPLALALGLALAAVAAGCSSPCQDLGDRICQCEPEGQVRTTCKSNVKARVKAASPSADESSVCSAILGTCPDPNGDVNQCSWMLNTCPGRVACGLALPQPGSDACTPIPTDAPLLDGPADPVPASPPAVTGS